jgi:hypothetical protein
MLPSRNNVLRQVLGMMLIMFLSGLFFACDRGTSPTTPGTSPLATHSLSPISTLPQQESGKVLSLTSSDPYRSFTAAESFPPAYAAAKAWHEDAQWYGVVPFTSITSFFALPLGTNRPSWFFRFGAADGQEYLVEVLDGQVIGTNELVIPAYIEQSLQQLDPLGDTWIILDSEDVLTAYREHEDSLLRKMPGLMMDYRLVKMSDQNNPVWMLYDAQNVMSPVFVVDAITGEVLSVE